jgi:hypothetical protein
VRAVKLPKYANAGAGRETGWRQWTICETHYATNERASPIYASGSKTSNIFAFAWCLRLAFWT